MVTVNAIADCLLDALPKRLAWAAVHMYAPSQNSPGAILHPRVRASLQAAVKSAVFGVEYHSRRKNKRISTPADDALPSTSGRHTTSTRPKRQRVETIEQLSDQKAVDMKQLSYLLLIAAHQGDVRQVRELLSAGANVNFQDAASGDTALSLASAAGSTAVVWQLLVAGADCYLYDSHRMSPLTKAASNGHDGVVKALLLKGQADAYAVCDDGRFALLHAAAIGATAVVKLLLELGGADVNAAVEATGEHALLAAARNGHLGLVKLLARAGAKVNRADKVGNTPLLEAARNGDTSMVQFLVSHGSKCIADYIEQRTPLMEAAAGGFVDCTAALLQSPVAQVQAKDSRGRTALQLARTHSIRDLLAVTSNGVTMGTMVQV